MSVGTIIAVCTSKKKGTPKADVGSGTLEVGFGLKDDAHGGDWHRQVSLLAIEQIDTMKAKGLDVKPGSFAENLTTSGFDLGSVKVGDLFTNAKVPLPLRLAWPLLAVGDEVAWVVGLRRGATAPVTEETLAFVSHMVTTLEACVDYLQERLGTQHAGL